MILLCFGPWGNDSQPTIRPDRLVEWGAAIVYTRGTGCQRMGPEVAGESSHERRRAGGGELPGAAFGRGAPWASDERVRRAATRDRCVYCVA